MNNKKTAVFFILLSIFSLSCKSTSIAKKDEVINRSIRIKDGNFSNINNGIFQGWGTSLCWWSNRIGDNNLLTDKAVELLFSENGLGLNIIRYNIGGGDNPSHNHITRSDSNMPGFMNYDADKNEYVYDWNADERQLNVFSKILKENKDVLVEVFSNSPPYFMTESGCSSGSLNGKSDNITKNNYLFFAEYLADVTEYISKKYNIDIYSIDPMNEANSPTWCAYSKKQEGCRISSGKAQSEILTLLHAELDKRGLNNINLSASDECSTNTQLRSLNMYSASCKQLLKKINVHTYNNFLSTLLKRKVQKTNYNFWVSESDYPYTTGSDNGEMGPALAFAKKIIKDLNELTPSAWVIWQAIANYYSDVDLTQEADLTKGYWGLCYADLNNDDIVLTKKYYAFAHFTKFIKPGSKILFNISDNCIAAYDKEKLNFCIITINDKNVSVNERINLSIMNKSVKLNSLYRTSGMKVSQGENLEEVVDLENYINNINRDGFNIKLVPNSINTICFDLE